MIYTRSWSCCWVNSAAKSFSWIDLSLEVAIDCAKNSSLVFFQSLCLFEITSGAKFGSDGSIDAGGHCCDWIEPINDLEFQRVVSSLYCSMITSIVTHFFLSSVQ